MVNTRGIDTSSACSFFVCLSEMVSRTTARSATPLHFLVFYVEKGAENARMIPVRIIRRHALELPAACSLLILVHDTAVCCKLYHTQGTLDGLLKCRSHLPLLLISIRPQITQHSVHTYLYSSKYLVFMIVLIVGSRVSGLFGLAPKPAALVPILLYNKTKTVGYI